MKSKLQGIPLICNMGVFTPAQREVHIAVTSQLFQTVQDVREAENGFEFTFPSPTSLAKMGEFMANERLCCPFLEFTLKVSSDNAPIALSLTGPQGTQEFLRFEFGEAFS